MPTLEEQSSKIKARYGPRYKRVLLKLSGEALQGDGYGIDPEVLAAVGQDIKEVVELGVQVAIVIGGGNIFRGLGSAANGMDRNRADTMGMLATIINAVALQDAFERQGLRTRAMSALPMDRVCDTFIQRRAVAHLEDGEVIVLGGGTSNPFFTTDTAAALRALELGADVVMKATKVDGVYDKDPMLHADAVRFERLTYIEVLRRGLKVMDGTAISLCRDNGLPIVVFDMTTRGNIRRVVCGEPLGTTVE